MLTTALCLTLATIAVVKTINAAFFWSRLGVPCESLLSALHRFFYLYHRRDVYQVVREAVQRNGLRFGSYRGLTPTLVVADVEMVREILIRQFNNFFGRGFESQTGDPLWDNQLSSLPYEQWKEVRQVVGHGLTSSKIRGMIPTFDRIAKRVVAKLEEISTSETQGSREIVLQHYLRSYVMDAFVASSFGIDLNCIDDPDSEFLKKASELFKAPLGGFIFGLAPGLLKYLPFISFPNIDSTRFFDKLGKHVIEEKRRHLDQVIRDRAGDTLDNIIIAQRENPNSQITDEVLAAQAFTMTFGALDTSVGTLEVLTYFIAVNPHVQEKMYAEITNVMQGRTDPQYDDLTKMKYLEAVILETLRHIPISFIMDRICTKETTVAGIPFRPGMIVEIAVSHMHYNPEYFPEPEQFIPERFLDDDDDYVHVRANRDAYLPFGGGPKNCIGRRLAILNLQAFMANLLMKVRLEKCSKTLASLKLKPGFNITDITVDPIIIRLEPRT